MQIKQYEQQLIEELKMNQSQSLLQSKIGSLVSKLFQTEQLKEIILLYQHKLKQFSSKEIIIGINALFVEDKYLELSRFQFECKVTKSKNQESIYIVVLFNSQGKEFMITNNQSQFKRLELFMKRYCLNKNFFTKFSLIESKQHLPIAQSFKNNQQFCVQIFEKKKLKETDQEEMFHNSISVSHYLQISPNILKLYEDNNKYYLLCQNMQLQSLEQLLLGGFEFKEVPMVSIIFMILQTLQKYQMKELYHGNINLQTVFVNVSSPILQITILNQKYIQNSNYKIENDLYNLGILLFQITFFTIKDKIKQFIDLNLIQEVNNQLQNPGFKQSQYKYLHRISQLDFLLLLLQPDVTLDKALRHQWFVTIKQNLKSTQYNVNKTINRQHLNTIVESNNELSMTSSQLLDVKGLTPQKFEIDEFLKQSIFPEPEDEFPIKSGIVNTFRMIPSKDKHDLGQQFQTKSKTFSNFEIKRGSLLQIQKQPTLK